jgi:hypothetical protein
MPRVFDARPDRLDVRDLPYRPPLRSLPPVYPADTDVGKFIGSYVKEKLVLDQGNQGACTGFGLACVANYLLWTRHVVNKVRVPFLPVSPRMLYELAKRYDEWPGVDYEGSSCRGALKGWNKHGVCAESMWPYKLNRKGNAVFVRPRAGWERDAASRPLGVYYRVDRKSIVDVQSAIVNIGAVYASGNAHDGWDGLLHAHARSQPPKKHAALPVIAPMKKKSSLGGHAFALVGYNERGFVVQNSWGTRWGASGFAILPYDDWITNATDVWACGLGVPTAVLTSSGTAVPLVSTGWRTGAGRALTKLDRSTTEPDNPPNDPWPFDHSFNFKAYEPWSTASAYEHTLVTGNDGELSATDFTRDISDKPGLAEEIVRRAPKNWFDKTGGSTLRLIIYAHGGLNSEEESIRRIRVLGPCFEANDLYPIFLTWKTGAGETLADMAQDWARKLVGDEAARSGGILADLGDAKDRAVEALGHVFGKGVWTEMRENAAGSTQAGHGLDLLVANLRKLRDDLGEKLEIHLVGHSAGSILCGHLLSMLAAKGSAPGLKIATATMYAAACSSEFAMTKYASAAQAGVINLDQLWLYVLSDGNEKADGLPSPQLPAYGKSLLYLVSRALEDQRKMPLLGMERALLPQYATDSDQWAEDELVHVQDWQKLWPPAKSNANLLRVIDKPQVVTTRDGDHSNATHGSFDNNIAVITETIERMRGAGLVAPLEWLDY